MRLPVLAATALCLMPAIAQGDTPPAIAVDPVTTEISGSWTYSTSNHQVSGSCPGGSPMQGIAVITARAPSAALMLQSGAVCDPASMCLFTGEYNGLDVIFYTSAVVDDEGGEASTAVRLSFTSQYAGGGEATSSYVHPKGFECRWTYDIVLTRSKGDES